MRLALAMKAGLDLPHDGVIAAFHPEAEFDLSSLPPDRTQIIQPNYPAFAALQKAGWTCLPEAEGRFAASLICLPRSKAFARLMLARAAARTDGLLIVDGARTDGIDSILKEVKRRSAIAGVLSKAHGKLFWLTSAPDLFADWATQSSGGPDGFVTVPGVFSADAVDAASRLLADAVPRDLSGRVADLGAGWGYVAARALQSEKVASLDLVEADRRALDCAQQNVADRRARFHWADARTWQPEAPLDAILTNPPFHTGRSADPELGRAFIRAAAGQLARHGRLFIVANRHLPYETTLRERFGQVDEVAGNNQFKIIVARKPRPQAGSVLARHR